MTTKALPSDSNVAARALLRHLLKERYGENQVELAEALGIRQPTLSDILSGKKGIGAKTLRGLARLAPEEAAALLAGTTSPPALPPSVTASQPSPTTSRAYESVRDSDRRGSLVRVREKLYARYPKRAVDEAIGSSDFIGAEEIDELEAFTFFDDLLRGQRFEEKHGRARLGERSAKSDDE